MTTEATSLRESRCHILHMEILETENPAECEPPGGGSKGGHSTTSWQYQLTGGQIGRGGPPGRVSRLAWLGSARGALTLACQSGFGLPTSFETQGQRGRQWLAVPAAGAGRLDMGPRLSSPWSGIGSNSATSRW